VNGHAVDVCWLRLETLKPGHLVFCASLLDAGERERAGRFVFDVDRDRFIVAHALLRLLLSRHVPIAPAAWRFDAGSHGKPFITRSLNPGFHFNISHTKGLVACAVTMAGEVGLDVETIDMGFPALRVARNSLAQEEVEVIGKAPPQDVAETFTTLWVLKEAYVKATGQGLSVPLDSFAFSLDPPRLRRAENALFDKDAWLFHLHPPTPGHILALALPWSHAEQVQIRQEEIVPERLFLAGPEWPSASGL
jgi:4'-phosphopantetheinyl transferase